MKRLESFFKINVKGNKAELVSAIDPQVYGERFRKFMKKTVIINEDRRKQIDSTIDNQLKKDQFL